MLDLLAIIDETQKQLEEQSNGLVKDVRMAESQLAILKESYLKVQGALELLAHQRKLIEDTSPPDTTGAEENVT